MHGTATTTKWENFTNRISEIPVKYLYLLFLLMAVGVSFHSWFISQEMEQWTRYNNFLIFKHSFEHLIHNKDLYVLYPQEYYDLYKYSPSFALCMGAFYWLPDLPSLMCWNLMNVIVFIMAIKKLPVKKNSLTLIMLFLTIEMMIALTSSQINIFITGFFILAWHAMENRKIWLATLLLVITIYIKIFGIVALAMFLLYPGKWKAALYTAFWTVLIGIMPLAVISPEQLLFLYKSWGNLLGNDYSVSFGVSLMGWWHTWFGMNINKQLFVLIGAILYAAQFLWLAYKKDNRFNLAILASTLIWVVIFNHKGESPTYIVALTGVAIWYFTQPANRTNTILLWLTLIFTSFSSTDLITPYWIASKYVEPYAVKAVFCSIVWAKILVDPFVAYITEKRISKEIAMPLQEAA